MEINLEEFRKKSKEVKNKEGIFYDKDGVEVGEPFDEDFVSGCFTGPELHTMRSAMKKGLCCVCRREFELTGYEYQTWSIRKNPSDAKSLYMFVCYDCRKDNVKFRNRFKEVKKTLHKVGAMGWNKIKE